MHSMESKEPKRIVISGDVAQGKNTVAGKKDVNRIDNAKARENSADA